jgi:hypothetical protein
VRRSSATGTRLTSMSGLPFAWPSCRAGQRCSGLRRLCRRASAISLRASPISRSRGARKVCAINRAKQDKLGTMPLRCYGFLVALRLKPPNNQREIRALATTPISRSLIGTASGLTFFRYPSADSVARPDQTSLIAKQRQIGRRLINVRHSSNLPRFLAQTLRAPLKRSG